MPSQIILLKKKGIVPLIAFRVSKCLLEIDSIFFNRQIPSHGLPIIFSLRLALSIDLNLGRQSVNILY